MQETLCPRIQGRERRRLSFRSAVPGSYVVWARPDFIPEPSNGGWSLVGFNDVDTLAADVTYTFALRTHSPALGVPYTQVPETQFGVNHVHIVCPEHCGAQSSFTVPVPDLEGAATFSTPGDDLWTAFVDDFSYDIDYASAAAPTTADGCKNGEWQAFALFKNQGDCVSYVATDGRNPPGGP